MESIWNLENSSIIFSARRQAFSVVYNNEMWEIAGWTGLNRVNDVWSAVADTPTDTETYTPTPTFTVTVTLSITPTITNT